MNGKFKPENKRTVVLSRYDKPVRIVPTQEVVDHIAKILKDNDVEMPYNLVTPQVAEGLVRAGAKVSDKHSGTVAKGQDEAWLKMRQEIEGEMSQEPKFALKDKKGRDVSKIGSLELSEDKDREGNAFYKRGNTTDLWNISPLLEKAGRQNAPIRLTTRNIMHIMDLHEGEFSGDYNKVISFLDDVFDRPSKLRRAKGGAMFVVVENEKNDKVAIIKLNPSDTGDYYNVESAGYYRKNKWKSTEDIIGELSEPTQSLSASDVSKPQNPQISGEETLNAETPIISADKGTENNPNNQIKDGKLSITPQKDADYLLAVEKGDTKKAEEMVKEAAKVRRFYLNFSKNSSIVMTLNIGKGVWASTSK